MARKVPDDVQKVFDKYTVNFVRRLNKDTAIQMLQKEFELNEERSRLMFEMFDKDRTGILSAWKFYLFFTSFGYSSNEYLDKYAELAEKGSGTADIGGLFDFIKELKTLNGTCFDQEDVETAIMGVAGEKERSVDLTKFIELISRIKLTRNYVPKKQ